MAKANDEDIPEWQKKFICLSLDVVLGLALTGLAVFAWQMTAAGWSGDWGAFLTGLCKVVLAVVVSGFLISQRSYYDPIRHLAKRAWDWA